jgi:hypothetical protein
MMCRLDNLKMMKKNNFNLKMGEFDVSIAISMKIRRAKIFSLYTIYFILSTIFISCKIGYGFNGASIPPEAKTVTVAYFNNNAPLASPLFGTTIYRGHARYLCNANQINHG